MDKHQAKPLQEVSEFCGVPSEIIIRFIQEEWIQPADHQTMMLDEEDIARIDLIWELTERLGVNEEGVPIILHLIDQLNCLHLELRRKNQINLE